MPRRLPYLLAFLLSLVLSLALAPAQAAITSFNIASFQDGTPNFDANNNPGNDAGPNNGIVRTLDTITYDVTYTSDAQTVPNPPNPNTVITLTLSAGLEWLTTQSSCPTGTVSPDRRTFTCPLGNVPPSTTARLQPIARVRGDVANGTTVSATGNISVGGSNVFTNVGPVIHTVSAAPKTDLVKGLPGVPVQLGNFADRSGNTANPGVVYAFPLSLVIQGGKGNEMLADSDAATPGGQLSISDIVTGISLNAQLFNWNSTYGPGCGQNNANSVRINELPNGSGAGNRAVTNSGTWTCSQSAAGDAIAITLTDADLSGNHRPIETRNGTALPATDTYLVAGWVAIWVPHSDFGASTTRNITNQYAALTSRSISGATNVEPDTSNNSRTFTISRVVSGGGGVSLDPNFDYGTAWNGSSAGDRLPPMTSLGAGDGVVVPRQIFGLTIAGSNRSSSGTLNNVLMCAKIDNLTQNAIASPVSGNVVQILTGTGRITDVIIEYGTGGDATTPAGLGYFSSDTAQRSATCADTDSPTGWATSLSSVPGGAAAVTRIRVRPRDGAIAAGQQVRGVIHLQALEMNPLTGNANPIGTRLTTTMTYRSDEQNNGRWVTGNYDPTNNNGNQGDRLLLSRSIVRITKTGSPSAITAEQTVQFTLTPSLTALVSSPPQTRVILTDTLPKELSYVSDSASLAPTSIIVNADGTTSLVWDLGLRTPGVTLSPITFRARAGFDVPNNTTATNRVLIEGFAPEGSVSDGSPVSSRSATANVSIGNPSAFRITKTTPNPEVGQNQPIVFRLQLANTGNQSIAVSQFIDILPFNGDGSIGDGRTPASNFSGTLSYDRILDSAAVGFTFEFTNAPGSTINPNPSLNTNTWCAEANFGQAGCPANKSQVTAIRITMPTFPTAAPTRTLELRLQPLGNRGGDRYTNDFSGIPATLGFITSVDATVNIIASQPNVLLVKRITAVNGGTTTIGGDNLANYQNDPNNPYDDNTLDTPTPNPSDTDKWRDPATFLIGGINGGRIQTGDEIEYTIYFISMGDVTASNVMVCDRIPTHSSFQPNAYASGRGIVLNLGSTTPLTHVPDADAGQYFAPGVDPTRVYPRLNCGGPNTNGAIVVRLGDLPPATAPGSPANSQGFVRFRVRVNQ